MAIFKFANCKGLPGRVNQSKGFPRPSSEAGAGAGAEHGHAVDPVYVPWRVVIAGPPLKKRLINYPHSKSNKYGFDICSNMFDDFSMTETFETYLNNLEHIQERLAALFDQGRRWGL